MSIPILTQVYDEMRRLAIAGSVVAGGDFRLKKLIPPLEQAGAKAPVFAKVAEAVKAVVDAKEQTSALALLELTTLVNAILYTQGTTGLAGDLKPIETTDLGTPTTQASARTLKPLLEALTTTGSGRQELIKDAFERGAFRDIRLVKPALEAIDDPYGEIGDFMAEKVLPLYGKAILPELRATFDLKGRGGHPRRLRLMHTLDPAGSRETVKQALDSGSKEVRIVAIECLGGAAEDLSFLLEQAKAKAQEVRQAAYRALATVDDDAAVVVLQKAMSGKDIELAADSLRNSRNAKLLRHIIAEAEQQVAAVRSAKDKKEIVPGVKRAATLIHCLASREDKETETFLLRIFAERNQIEKIKGPYAGVVGAAASGSDLNSAIVHAMGKGTKTLTVALVDAHASLPPDDLHSSFQAARCALPADKVYSIFSSYITAKVDEKKKQRDLAWSKREAIFDALGLHNPQFNHLRNWSERQEKLPPLDPRWLNLAVQIKHFGLVRLLIRPGFTAANTFLKETFAESLKKAKQLQECQDVVATMIDANHPDATDAYLAVLEKFGKKTEWYGWFCTLIVRLPKSAIPKLEALVPQMSDKMSDTLLESIQQLREKA